MSLSGDSNTAIVGGFLDNNATGAAWVWTRSGGVWTQQGKLVASGASGNAFQGYSVSLSAGGNTALIGAPGNESTHTGAAWVWTRSGGVWTQGFKLVGSGASGSFVQQGISVSLSGEGNTAIIGANADSSHTGAAWVWTRSGGVWTQQGAKRVGSGVEGHADQGISVSVSADGNKALIGGSTDGSSTGATWVWTRSGEVWTQQGTKLVGVGAIGTAFQGTSLSLSADNSTAIVGGPGDDGGAGAAWVFGLSTTTGTLTGAVRDASNNLGISGALVNFNGSSTLTNESGIYTLTNLGCAFSSLTVSKTGYVTASIDYNFTGCPGTNTENFILWPLPAISGIVPNSGTTAGGDTVTISGKNLGSASSVTFGGAAATVLYNPGTGELRPITPPHAAGTVNVTVTTPDGSVTATNGYTYISGPSAPIANFTWPPSPPAGQEVQFTDTSTGAPTSWSWTFGDGGTSTVRNPKHTFSVAGSYTVALTTTNAVGSDSVTKSVSVAPTPCPYPDWTNLKYPTSPLGGELEPLGTIPQEHRTLHKPEIDQALDDRVAQLKASLPPSVILTRLSGYRPPDYQDHFYRLKQLHDAMYQLIKTPTLETAIQCRTEIAKVVEEVGKSRHDIGYQSKDPTKLSVASVSYHSTRLALDVSINPLPSNLGMLLTYARLVAPCKKKSIHLQKIEDPNCGEPSTVTATASSQGGGGGLLVDLAGPSLPIRILLKDPEGRRVGFDPTTGAGINEIGQSATYSGPDSDPQIVIVEDAPDGDYRVEAVAVAVGVYTIVLSAEAAEDGGLIASNSTSGNVVAGQPIDPLRLDVQKTVPQLPPRRRSVRH